MHAIRVADAIREVDPFWFEEPCPAENVDALAEAAFRELFEKRAVDIINPDVCNTGGILETKEIAAMAEPYYVGVAPHNYNSVGVALASTVHFRARGVSITVWVSNVEGGYIPLPDAPGLGVDMDEDALIRRADISVGRKSIRRYSDEVDAIPSSICPDCMVPESDDEMPLADEMEEMTIKVVRRKRFPMIGMTVDERDPSLL
ncbi:D-xylonate dehydratase [Geodia barretti]|uniref:D-xylonate dehydratase n=1 Tax=Geodia barretti TaxID=519541 RepID=A0AA35X4E0_GEOBA|nr:D-xylonate dehydratase [Geodia barretti]